MIQKNYVLCRPLFADQINIATTYPEQLQVTLRYTTTPMSAGKIVWNALICILYPESSTYN